MSVSPVRTTSGSESGPSKRLAVREPSGDNIGGFSSDDQMWRLATALSGAATPVDVAMALAADGAAAARSTFANMAMLDARRRRLKVVHGSVLDPAIAARWTEFGLADPTPLGEAVRSGLAVLLGSPDEIANRFPDLLADTLSSGLGATASLPLRAAGVTLGAIGFGWPGPQSFGPAQIRHLDLIAQMAAQALDRALLYERERDQLSARERAEVDLLQEAFLPATLPRTRSLDMAAAYLPASDAPFGGDWYDAFPVDGGTFLVIGDVAGHGMQAAATMAQLRNAARAFADEEPAPAQVLTRLNRMFCRLDPGETATAIFAMWDPGAATLQWSNAGHLPLLRCRRGEVAFLVPPPGGMLLGAKDDCRYRAESKVLRPGTTLLFYTDGLVETRGLSIDQGLDDLRAFVDGLSDLAPQALCDQVVEWRLDAGRREDDMCLLAVRLS